jgi:hypothetical protein
MFLSGNPLSWRVAAGPRQGRTEVESFYRSLRQDRVNTNQTFDRGEPSEGPVRWATRSGPVWTATGPDGRLTESCPADAARP